jgi:hypothetical protein
VIGKWLKDVKEAKMFTAIFGTAGAVIGWGFQIAIAVLALFLIALLFTRLGEISKYLFRLVELEERKLPAPKRNPSVQAPPTNIAFGLKISEFNFGDRFEDQSGTVMKLLDFQIEGLLVEYEASGKKETLKPSNPHDPKPDWIFQVRKI